MPRAGGGDNTFIHPVTSIRRIITCCPESRHCNA